jgi:hypothetical protein
LSRLNWLIAQDRTLRGSSIATQPLSARLFAFRLTAAFAIVAFAAILASQLARPAAPVAVHLTEAEFAAAKCYALRTTIETGTDPVAVALWAEKERVDAQACPELLAKRAALTEQRRRTLTN